MEMPRGVYVVETDSVYERGELVQGSGPRRWDTNVGANEMSIMWSFKEGGWSTHVYDLGKHSVIKFERSPGGGGGAKASKNVARFCRDVRTMIIASIVAAIVILILIRRRRSF
jgi:hypothetical protein